MGQDGRCVSAIDLQLCSPAPIIQRAHRANLLPGGNGLPYRHLHVIDVIVGNIKSAPEQGIEILKATTYGYFHFAYTCCERSQDRICWELAL